MNDANLPQPPGDGEPLHIREDGDTGDRFLVYQTKSGLRAELLVQADTFWATQAQMAEMFGVDVRTVSYHLTNVFREGELDADSVIQDSWITAADGKLYRTRLYSLDAMIAAGYRVGSRLGTVFRIWATQVLIQYITKGFVIDDERLKNVDGKPDYFEELLERIRDIRSSEKRMWTRICELATFCVDYDPYDDSQRTEFYAEIQNTLHWAVVEQTAPEVVRGRVDHTKEGAGLTNYKGAMPTVAEAKVAKNLLQEPEIKALNHITSLMLEFFDSQVEQRRATTLGQFQIKLRDLIKLDGRPLKPLGHAGKVTRAAADRWAAQEVKAYKDRKRIEAEVSGEQALEEITKKVKAAVRVKKAQSP